MDSMDYWRLCDELSVLQAAALIVGVDPSSEVGANCESWPIDKQPAGYYAAKSALVNAINARRLPATLRHSAREYGWADQMADIDAGEAEFVTVTGSTAEDGEQLDVEGGFFFKAEPDWRLTTIALDDLRAWLRLRGITTGFFFAGAAEAGPGYLDPKDSRYPRKLAAAVSAWMAVTDAGGKSPKSALERWLREHAAEFGLTNADGRPIEKAMTECSTVANWDSAGGAPKTPD